LKEIRKFPVSKHLLNMIEIGSAIKTADIIKIWFVIPWSKKEQCLYSIIGTILILRDEHRKV